MAEKRTKNYDKRERFQFFKSFEDFQSITNKTLKKLPRSYYIVKRSTERGLNEDASFIFGDYPRTSFEEMESGVKKFIDQDKLTGIVEDVKELFASIDLGGSFKKDRLKPTDQPIGVFSFDLASQGLFKPMEYYSPDLEELVDPDKVFKLNANQFVTERDIADKKKKTYFVTQQQEGTMCMAKKVLYVSSLMSDGFSKKEAEVKAKKKYPGCRLKFQTRTKKVYLTRVGKELSPEQKGKEKYVDLFLPTGGSAYQTPRTLMYAVLPSLLAAYFLNQAGIKTRILGLNSSSRSYDYANKMGIVSGEAYRFMNAYVIKDYADNFDFDRIAKLTADSRTFRWLLFKDIGVQYWQLDKDFDAGDFSMGYPVNGENFDILFERYKRYYIQENNKSTIKNSNPRLMIASKIVPTGSQDDEELKKMATDEFFRLMDGIDLEFNGAKIALPRIKNREQRMGNEIDSVRQRLMGVIAKATRTDLTDSKYSMTAKENKAALNLRKTLRKDVNTVFKNI